MSEEVTDVPQPVLDPLWRSRRKMAASSVIGILAIQIFTFLVPDMSKAQIEMLSMLMWVHGAIVGAYMGFKMVERGFGKK